MQLIKDATFWMGLLAASGFGIHEKNQLDQV